MAEGPTSSEIERDLKLILGIPCHSFANPVNHQVPINAVHDVYNSHKKQNTQFSEMNEKRMNNKLRSKDLGYRRNMQVDMYSQEQATLHNMQHSNMRESHSWRESRKVRQKKDAPKGSVFTVNVDRKISILKPDHSSNMRERDHGKMDGHNAQNNQGNANANNSVLKKLGESTFISVWLWLLSLLTSFFFPCMCESIIAFSILKKSQRSDFIVYCKNSA